MIENITVRFFVVGRESDEDYPDDYNLDDDLIEVSEETFLATQGEVYYERHTKWANGVDQICLVKYGLIEQTEIRDGNLQDSRHD